MMNISGGTPSYLLERIPLKVIKQLVEIRDIEYFTDTFFDLVKRERIILYLVGLTFYGIYGSIAALWQLSSENNYRQFFVIVFFWIIKIY